MTYRHPRKLATALPDISPFSSPEKPSSGEFYVAKNCRSRFSKLKNGYGIELSLLSSPLVHPLIFRRHWNWREKATKLQPTFFLFFYFFWFVGILGSASRAKFPVSTMLALRLNCSTAAPRKFYPSEDWLSSRCLTSVIALVFPSWHQPLTSQLHYLAKKSRRKKIDFKSQLLSRRQSKKEKASGGCEDERNYLT